MNKMNTKLSDIKADILTKWDRKHNTNCKFLPGDKVNMKHIYGYESSLIKERRGSDGVIVAVSSGAPGLIRGHWSRCYTRYFVQFEDGYIAGILSGSLVPVQGS